jgi:hypothetical protein
LENGSFLSRLKKNSRELAGNPIVDAVFISNMRDATDRRRYCGKWHPRDGHFNGPRYWLNGTAGRTRAIDSTTKEFETESRRKRAQEQFISATKWAEDNGAKVVLLAAGAKRLFGEDGTELKERFPDMLFSIGDIGTMLVLKNEILRAAELSHLDPNNSRIGVLGPYGFLWETSVKTLSGLGYKLIGAGPNVSGLKRVADTHIIETCQHFEDMGKVDMVVACTHSEKIRLTPAAVDLIRHKNKKLLVIDVSEPSNLRYREYQNCKNSVIRQDAGNAYAPNLKYVLGPISYKMFRLTDGVTLGCFAEALSLAAVLKRGEAIHEFDWFEVNEKQMDVVANLFKHDGFTLPTPRCFGAPERSFDLNL